MQSEWRREQEHLKTSRALRAGDKSRPCRMQDLFVAGQASFERREVLLSHVERMNAEQCRS